jgi:hypothetical protein
MPRTPRSGISRHNGHVVRESEHRYVVGKLATTLHLVRRIRLRISVEENGLELSFQGVEIGGRVERLGIWDNRVVVACPPRRSDGY